MSVPFVPPDVLSGMAEETPVLVAFSGGADSRLLLELTVRWARAKGPHGAPITAAHLHHGLRGAEADRDEAFCREAAHALGVRYLCRHVDVPALARASGRSTEWEARLARYAFFADVMRQEHIPLLLTAHHADDQLETVLLRLMRGSGTHGLGGIPAVRRTQEGLLLRPLLEATRADILEACQTLGLSYVTDSTNLQDDCTRNRIRHHIIPELESVSGVDVPQHVTSRLCRTAREDDDCLWHMAMDALPSVLDTDNFALRLPALRVLPPALAKRCMAYAYRQAVCASLAPPIPLSSSVPPSAPLPSAALLPPAAQASSIPSDSSPFDTLEDMSPDMSERELPLDRTLSCAHLDALQALVHHSRMHATLSLPGGWQARIQAQHLLFSPPQKVPAPPPSPMPLPPGHHIWSCGQGRWRLDICPQQCPATPCAKQNPGVKEAASASLSLFSTGTEVCPECFSAVFPADIPQPLWARQRQPGDSMPSHGMTKKLKKVLNQAHLPLELRDSLPLLCLPNPDAPDTPGAPLWFPSVLFRDGYPAPTDGPCLCVTVTRLPEENKGKENSGEEAL